MPRCSGKTPQNVNIKKQQPLHTTYITAWANRQGTVSFRDDVYQYDAQGKTTFDTIQAVQGLRAARTNFGDRKEPALKAGSFCSARIGKAYDAAISLAVVVIDVHAAVVDRAVHDAADRCCRTPAAMRGARIVVVAGE